MHCLLLNINKLCNAIKIKLFQTSGKTVIATTHYQGTIKSPYECKKFIRECNFFREMLFICIEGKSHEVVIAIDNKKILLMFYNRDEQALSETVRHYGDICKAVAKDILNNEEDAEECVNDALWTVWNAIPPAQPENYFAYLLKTVRNTAINRYKSKQRNKRGNGQIVVAIEELSEVLPALDNVELQLEHREILNAITVFLRTLPQDQRDIFVLR